MRILWIFGALALVAPSMASAGAGVTFASGSNTCELLGAVPLTPPELCPNVTQSGTATGVACVDSPNGSRCDVIVHVTSRAQGFVVTSRQLVAEIVVLDGNENATQICTVIAPGSTVGCEAEATASLALNADGCRDFRVRSGLRDIGLDGTYVFHIQTDRSLKLCREGQDANVLEN